MCNLCKGTRVIHEESQVSILYQTCPTCGPYTKEEARLRAQYIRDKYAKLEAEFAMRDVS